MNKYLRKIALSGSIILHILFLLFWMFADRSGWFLNDIVPTVEPEPIIFDLANTVEKPKRVIETPDDAQVVENQKQADFLSDKNALARNEERNTELPIDDPFSRGDYKFEELPTNRGPIGKQANPNQQSEKPEEKNQSENNETTHGDYYVSASEFDRDHLTNPPKQNNPGVPNASPRVRYDNQDSRAPDMGGLSFNTYDWDFAPWALEFQRRVNGNVFPPPAYSMMGIISGTTVLRFRVYPDGTLTDVHILKYDGHKALMETSVRAIEISAPFMPLPSNFPEKYLQVTYTFSYSVSRN